MFRLALRNLRRCWRDYLAYFVSLAAITTSLYLFLGLRYNPFIGAAIESRGELVRASLVASALILVIGFDFAWYSSDFFLRRRYREMGLYNLYGMGRRQIGGMIFSENLVLGVCAVLAGSLLGFALSKLFVMVLLRIMNLDYAVGLSFSFRALRDTGLYFSVLLAPIVLRSVWLLARYNLASLFRAEKAAQAEPKRRLWLGFASLAALLGGYALALSSTMATVILNFFTVTTITVVASYGIVSVFLPWTIRLLRDHRPVSWRSGRLIAWSQLEYRIRSNVNLLVTISITGAAAMIALGFGFNAMVLVDEQNAAAQPWDLSFVVRSDDPKQDTFDRLVRDKLADYGLTLVEAKHQELLRLDAFDNSYEGIGEGQRAEGAWKVRVAILPDTATGSGSALPRGGSFAGRPAPFSDRGTVGMLEANTERVLSLANGEQLRLGQKLDLPPVNSSLNTIYIVLVEAADYAALLEQGHAVWVSYNYRVDDREALGGLTKELSQVLEGYEFHSHEFNAYYTRIFRLYLFLGFLVGLVFLGTSCSILFFKQMAETRADEERYRVLLNIGAPRSVLSRVIALQTLPLFAVPLLMGILHSVVALNTMALVFKRNFTLQIAVTIVSFSVIFLLLGAYTTRSYRKAVLRPLAG